MKIDLQEFDGCFSFSLEAETMEDAALLVRFGTNRTSEIRTATTNVSKDGKFEAGVVIGKSLRSNSDVVKRK